MQKEGDARLPKWVSGIEHPLASDNCMLQPLVTGVKPKTHQRDLRPWILGQGKRGIGGFTCIPETVRQDIQELVEQLDSFLGADMEAEMVRVNFQARVSQLVAAGHILLPTSLTAVAEYLGTLDTSSLL